MNIFQIVAKNIKLQNFLSASKFPKNYSTEATIKLKGFRLHRLDKGPPEETKLVKQDALHYYRQMKIIREMEAASAVLYREKVIRGFCHLYSGQEACAVGIKAAMRPNDSIITSYRAHGTTYVMGASVLSILSELTGRKSGVVRGKGGSMHLYWKNFYGGNGIVGAQVPLGTGIAFANKYLNIEAATFALYGEGAANQGQVFEAFNLAKIYELPIIFVCENNWYAMGTPKDRAAGSVNFYTRGDFIPGIWVDGQVVLEVREACRFAVEYVKTNGPLVMELETYRYFGHSLSDPGTSYRTREEIQEIRKTRDPINLFKTEILQSKLATEEELKELDKEAKAEVQAAYAKSKTDPEIGLEEMTADIYSQPIEMKVRGVHPWQIYKHIRVGKTINL